MTNPMELFTSSHPSSDHNVAGGPLWRICETGNAILHIECDVYPGVRKFNEVIYDIPEQKYLIFLANNPIGLFNAHQSTYLESPHITIPVTMNHAKNVAHES